jgi:uncharacterized protein
MTRPLATNLIQAAFLAALIYVGLLLFLLLTSRAAIYPFLHDSDVRAPAGLPGVSLTEISTDAWVTLAWVVPPEPGRPMVPIFVGNAGQMGHGVLKGAPLVEQGYGVAILSYPGANGAPGRPSETAIMAAARDLLDHVDAAFPEAPAPVLYGISLGAAVAVQLAAERAVGAVILEAPFTATYDLARDIYPFLPPFNLLPGNRWEALRAAPAVTVPALVVHGRRDEIVPYRHGQRMAEALAGETTLRLFDQARHNDLHLHGADAAVLAFLAEIHAD